MMDANLHLWNFDSLSSTRDVFLLFAIPVGGGIPAGVLMAQSKGIGWAAMTLIYFVSDVVLAFLFEPILKGIGWLGRHIDFFGKIDRTHEVFNPENHCSIRTRSWANFANFNRIWRRSNDR